MWEGRGWKRTQRQVGVAALAVILTAEIWLKADIPIGAYSVVGGLLGLDVLVEALDRLKGK